MAAKKRSGQTRRKGPTPRNPQRRSSTTTTAPAAQPAPSGRYTPKAKARGPFRPTWHRVIGTLLVVAGLGLFVVNDLAWRSEDHTSELQSIMRTSYAAFCLKIKTK